MTDDPVRKRAHELAQLAITAATDVADILASGRPEAPLLAAARAISAKVEFDALRSRPLRGDRRGDNR